ETLRADEADALEDDVGAVEHVHARAGQDLGQLAFRCRFVVVIAEYRDDGDLDPFELLRKRLHLLRPAVRGEVAAEREHVGALMDFSEDLAELPLARSIVMDIADGGDANLALTLHHCSPSAVFSCHTSLPVISWTIGNARVATVASLRRSRKPHSLTSMLYEKREINVPW